MNEKKKSKKIAICYGLPGSGKTYFCKNYVENAWITKAERVNYVDVDDIFKKLFVYEKSKQQPITSDEYLKNRFKEHFKGRFSSSYEKTIIDGLFTTNNHLKILIEVISEEMTKIECEFEIIIYEWNEDRETCIKNDFKRRNESSEKSIKNLQYENIDKKLLPDDININIIRKIVLLKDEYKQYFEEHYLYLSEEAKKFVSYNPLSNFGESKFIYSSEWSEVDTPLEFEELFDLIERIDVSFPYLILRKIQKECVEILERIDTDYYTPPTKYFKYSLDLKKMYEIINENILEKKNYSIRLSDGKQFEKNLSEKEIETISSFIDDLNNISTKKINIKEN